MWAKCIVRFLLLPTKFLSVEPPSDVEEKCNIFLNKKIGILGSCDSNIGLHWFFSSWICISRNPLSLEVINPDESTFDLNAESMPSGAWKLEHVPGKSELAWLHCCFSPPVVELVKLLSGKLPNIVSTEIEPMPDATKPEILSLLATISRRLLLSGASLSQRKSIIALCRESVIRCNVKPSVNADSNNCKFSLILST